MKKPFWMKLITCMLAVMLLIGGVLPTKVTFAANKLDKSVIEEYYYTELPPVHRGTWVYAGNTYTSELIPDYVENNWIYVPASG